MLGQQRHLPPDGRRCGRICLDSGTRTRLVPNGWLIYVRAEQRAGMRSALFALEPLDRLHVCVNAPGFPDSP